MKYYTIGEVFRLKLLKNHKGEPYTAKATISKIVSRLELKNIKTAFGMAKLISAKQIEKLNSRFN